MKSIKKILIRLFKAGFILLLILYFGLFLYYKYGWRSHYSKQQVGNVIATIQKAPVFSDSFYMFYDKVYNNRHEKITSRYWKCFWTEFLVINEPIQNNWQFVTANMITPYTGYRYKIAIMTLAFRINSDVPPEKCFDYVMSERYKSYCKEFKLNDTITNLTDTDKIISFIVANEKPWIYRRNPIKYKIETDSLKQLLIKL